MQSSVSIRRNQDGQTLLELLIALVILITALVGTVALIVNSISASRESRNRLIATSLAREAIEMARATRDSNWVTSLEKICSGGTNAGAVCIGDSECSGGGSCLSESWDTGLVGSNPAIPVLDGVNPYQFDFSPADFSDALARIHRVGDLYQQGAGVGGAGSEFYRLIYINPICHDATDNEFIVGQASADTCGNGSASAYPTTVGYRIIAEVRWPSQNASHNVRVEDRLYNWQTL